MMNRRHFLPTLLGAATLGLLAMPTTQAQTPPGAWTTKPVRIIAAGPAGGSADIVARLLADQLARQTGQTVIVEPKPGAGGMLAVNELNMAPRDGTTLLLGVNSLVSEIPHILKAAAQISSQITPLAEVRAAGWSWSATSSCQRRRCPR